jgi:hypothetical protein
MTPHLIVLRDRGRFGNFQLWHEDEHGSCISVIVAPDAQMIVDYANTVYPNGTKIKWLIEDK